ncbi:chlorophyll(ide) b reductase NOL [Citrus sinensis]|uniref:Chlorophyll(Ide) b reductase NOL n=1 Tax=Citrus sinensis TaxID=2711 RepID=A0ACB8L7A9_CITSI|nr:chlorophyll(ide) b reductase NOL [Citrus sinensis]
MASNAAINCSLINFSSKNHQLILTSLPIPHYRYGSSTVRFQRNCFSLRASKSYHSPIIRADSSSSSSSVKREPMLPPYNVLITGSTKGIGYALAKEFLKAGDNVIICSRSALGYTQPCEDFGLRFCPPSIKFLHAFLSSSVIAVLLFTAERVDSAVQSLREEFGEQHVWGTKCDVREGNEVADLVAFAQKNLKYVDIWAMKMMREQPRGGHIFNIDGAGSDGRPTPRFAAYGATKRSVVHLTKSLQAELQMQDVKNVVVHNLSPGMVTTDLLMSGATTKQAKFFINVLAEPADVVAECLVPKIRSIAASGSTKPTYLRFLTGVKAYSQIFSRIAFGARRNRYILED